GVGGATPPRPGAGGRGAGPVAGVVPRLPNGARAVPDRPAPAEQGGPVRRRPGGVPESLPRLPPVPRADRGGVGRVAAPSPGDELGHARPPVLRHPPPRRPPGVPAGGSDGPPGVRPRPRAGGPPPAPGR